MTARNPARVATVLGAVTDAGYTVTLSRSRVTGHHYLCTITDPHTGDASGRGRTIARASGPTVTDAVLGAAGRWREEHGPELDAVGADDGQP